MVEVDDGRGWNEAYLKRPYVEARTSLDMTKCRFKIDGVLYTELSEDFGDA